MKLIKLLDEWIADISSEKIKEKKLVAFVESLGFSNVIWMLLKSDEIHLREYSNSIKPDFINQLKKIDNYDTVKEWVVNAIYDEMLSVGGKRFQVVLHVHSDDVGNVSLLLADIKKETHAITDVRVATRLAMRYIENYDTVKTLQNAIKLTFGQIGEPPQLDIDIKPSHLSQEFINDVIPSVFYSLAHEGIGPIIIDSVPGFMKESEYLITAVKIFSGLDSDMVSELGHVYSSNPVKDPLVGEIVNIIFAIPNKIARGRYEVHAISILINQQYANLSRSIISQIKTELFSAVERVRMIVDEQAWALATDDIETYDNTTLGYINSMLSEIRTNVAINFALLMRKADVL